MAIDLVSIIMLSKDNGRYVEETVRSVLAQTYQNWEIIFMDDSSKDDTISKMMDLMEEDRQRLLSLSKHRDPSTGSGIASGIERRIHVSQNVTTKGFGASLNSALRDARGRWIAFLNVGDVWEPTKLEHQITFMEQNGYAFSYTKFGLINSRSEDRGVVIGGKAHITYKEMQKCCWPNYLTVMYDAQVVGKMRVRNLKKNNDYALWLNVCEKTDCHLLDECLAKNRTKWGRMGKLLLTNKMDWRYDCFRIEEDLRPMKATLYTIRNGFYGIVKWFKYVERI